MYKTRLINCWWLYFVDHGKIHDLYINVVHKKQWTIIPK